ncbi:MAG: hypothetical protein DK304_001382 [Chloroflexi bacterium]|jgi:hypothetical protein|nr:MAG: hypothetical protein DK304_001382 [Chloroflexota bacterium]
MADMETIQNLIDKALDECTIAIVGLSPRIDRPSNEVARYLREVGYRIIPVNPLEKEILGERSYSALEEIAEPIGVVNIFKRPGEVEPVVKSAILIGAKYVWMQEGIVNDGAAEIAVSEGLIAIMDRCIKKEHEARAYRLKSGI